MAALTFNQKMQIVVELLEQGILTMDQAVDLLGCDEFVDLPASKQMEDVVPSLP